jgi:hypothetical protein
MKTTSERGKP